MTVSRFWAGGGRARAAPAAWTVALVGALVALLAGSLALPKGIPGDDRELPSPVARVSAPMSGSATHRATVGGVPSSPTNVAALPHPGAVNVSWGPPAQPGSGALLGFTVLWWSSVTLFENRTVGPSATSRWIAGLENGTLYEFEVAASNGNGTGPYSLPVAARPGSVPAPPVLLGATSGNGSISVAWLPAGSTPGYAILGYVVHTSGNGSSANVSVGGNTTRWNGTGFTNGRSYHVTVRAENAIGVGPESAEASVEPAAPPSAPRNLSAQWDASAGRLLLMWNAPGYLGGLTLGNYSLGWASSEGRSGSTHLSPHATEYLLPVAGARTSFSVSLAAVNGAGPGAPATLEAATPATGASASPGGSPAGPLGVGLVLLGVGAVAAVVALLLSRRRGHERPGDRLT